MAQIENRTQAPFVVYVRGEKTRKRSYKQVIPSDKGPQVVEHEVEETSEGPIKQLVIPPTVGGNRGLLDIERDELKQLKTQADFMDFVKSGTLAITEH
jgi:hypothetical protein